MDEHDLPDERDDDPEARLVVTGEPVEGDDPLFIGRLSEVRSYLQSLPADQHGALSVVTDGRIYAPAELLAD
jgi:hypothetical protein